MNKEIPKSKFEPGDLVTWNIQSNVYDYSINKNWLGIVIYKNLMGYYSTEVCRADKKFIELSHYDNTKRFECSCRDWYYIIGTSLDPYIKNKIIKFNNVVFKENALKLFNKGK